MNQLTKAQITVGLLANFATIWPLIEQAKISAEPLLAIGLIVLHFIVLIVLSIVIMGILQWVKIFDLKTNAILTLFVLVTLNIVPIL